MHVFVAERQRRQVWLQDHLVFGGGLETDTEEKVVEDFLVRVGRVLALGVADEIEVEVRRDRRHVVYGAGLGASEVPDDALGLRHKARLA